MTERLGDAPIDPQYVEEMNVIARSLDQVFNGVNRSGASGDHKRTTGFVLLVFPFHGEPGRCNFISNGANREDVVTLMKEMIRRFEGQPEMKGRA